MRKIISILIFGMLLLNIVLVSANENHESEIEEGKKLVESEISCDKLTDEQLETIGDYYMEQMHPGEAHEMMHDMMGGHDSETTKLMHINMAKGIYCGEDISGMMNGGMMPMMMNMMGGQNIQGNSMMQGMTGNYYSSYGVFGWIFMILIIIILVLLIVWLTKQIQNSGRVKRKRK